MSKQIAEYFENSFLSRSIEEQVTSLDNNELAKLFLALFMENQPVLEAGCGSGKWCKWFSLHGIRADGVDWSEELCDRAQQAIPECVFVACDVQNTPFDDNSYGGLIALGTIEHISHGPMVALSEFYRILRPGGIAVITVPNGGSLLRANRLLTRPYQFLRANNLMRRLYRKPEAGKMTLAEASKGTVQDWYPLFSVSEVGWYFYQYEFNAAQMREFLKKANFTIVKEFAEFKDQGIVTIFGFLAGRYNDQRKGVRLTIIGNILKKVLLVSTCGHMLCYVVQKPLSLYR